MFNDEYGLTKAVLNGEKNMTRRIVPNGTPLGNWNETLKYSRYKQGSGNSFILVVPRRQTSSTAAIELHIESIRQPTRLKRIDCLRKYCYALTTANEKLPFKLAKR